MKEAPPTGGAPLSERRSALQKIDLAVEALLAALAGLLAAVLAALPGILRLLTRLLAAALLLLARTRVALLLLIVLVAVVLVLVRHGVFLSKEVSPPAISNGRHYVDVPPTLENNPRGSVSVG